MEERAKDVHIKTNPNVVIKDGVPVIDVEPHEYPIYRDEAGTIAYMCRVINGKLV